MYEGTAQAGRQSYAADHDYIAAIDGVRAISVVSVLIYHLNERIIPSGFVGVDFFFVVSGFVVTKSMMAYGGLDLFAFIRKFYRRRLDRIVPALVFFLVVISLLSTLFVPTIRTIGNSDIVGVSAFYGLSNFALYFLNGDYFSSHINYNPFTHTWSLAVEEQFYFIFPFMIFMAVFSRRFPGIRGNRVLFLPAICLASLALSAVVSKFDQSLAFFTLPTRLWELGAGGALYLWLEPSKQLLEQRVSQRPAIATGLTALVVAGLGVSFFLADAAAFPFPWAIAPVFTALALITLVVVAPRSPVARVLSLPSFVFLGRISYSLYLWHFGIIVLFRWTVGIEQPVHQLMAAAISVMMATLSYGLIEAPVRYSATLAARSDAHVILRSLGIVVAGSLLSGLLFAARPYISLTSAVDSEIWSPRGRTALVVDGCTVVRQTEALSNGEIIRFVPQDCKGEPSTRIAVIGDSHGISYEAMLQQIAAAQQRQVEIFFRSGCQPFTFGASSGGEACAEFRSTVLDHLRATLSEGDVVFLPGLRVARRKLIGDDDIRFTDELDLEVTPADITEAEASFERLEDLLSAGVRIVVEAPKPVFLSHPSICADWFNRANPNCALGFEADRADMERRRSRVLAAMQAFAVLDPGVSIWDPLPLLCPEETCSAWRGIRRSSMTATT